MLLRFGLARFVGIALGVARGALCIRVRRLLAAHVGVECLQRLVDLGVGRLQRVHLRGGLGLLTPNLVAIGPGIAAAVGCGDDADEYCEQR